MEVLIMGKPNRLAERLIELLERDWDAGCIEWHADNDPTQYGPRLSLRCATVTASRYALILATGVNPAGMDSAHGPCHNRRCVNPLHLRWATRAENLADRVRDGTVNHGERQGSAKLRSADVRVIRRRVADGETQTGVAAEFGICQPHVSRIVRRLDWAHLA